jgi:hypothetical protein
MLLLFVIKYRDQNVTFISFDIVQDVIIVFYNLFCIRAGNLQLFSPSTLHRICM